MNWRVLGVAIISLWGILLLAMGSFKLANAPLIPVITILMLLVIVPCNTNCLTYFVSSQVNKLQKCSASLTRIYKITLNHGKYHSPLDGHRSKDSEA